MEYKAFALKYRPQKFEEVIGQDHVVTSLKNAILSKRVHHAYLFSGPRGVGKTSLARILARALNCEAGPTVTPCGKCASCSEITRGTSLDIIEIDGASNRGIDDIRSLRENVKLSPAHSRYKIYIIDEVHQITADGFNALLKTLEEPPRHVKFIFATTHPQKVIPTILSRCQKFQFNLVPLEKIVQKLKKIISRESVKIEENLLYVIGRASGGSIRDAESLLDQIVPVVLEKGSVGDILSFLGIIDEESLNSALAWLVEKDLPSLLGFIDRIVKDGKDLGAFVNALIEHLRNLLLAKVSIESFQDLSDLSPQSKEFILKLSGSLSPVEILEIIDLLIEAKDLSRRLNTVRVPLEVALIKFAYEQNQDIPAKTDKPKKRTSPRKNEPPSEPTQPSVGLDIDIDDFGLEPPEQSPVDNLENIEITEKEEPADGILLIEIEAKWQNILSDMHRVRAGISSHLSLAQPVASAGTLLTIGFQKKDYFHKEIVESNKNLKFIEGAIAKFTDKPIGVKFIFTENSPQAQKAPVAQLPSEPQDQEGQGDLINELLDTFGGRVHTED